MASVREMAQRDAQNYNAKGSDSLIAKITDKIGNTVDVGGRAASHNTSYDSQDGSPVNQPQSNITFSMTELTENGLIFRNSRSQVDMQGWVVEWVDLGKTLNGTITETKPDETFGLVVCFIQENESDIIPTYEVILSSTANGSCASNISPFEEGIYNILRNTLFTAVNKPDAGYRSDGFLVNGVAVLGDILNKFIIADTEIIGQFIVSVIKQLQIAVSGVGTTNPVPGNYDREQGTFQLIEAFESDVNYIFDEFKQDNNLLVGNPVNVEITDNTLVVAYFKFKWAQWVFNTEIVKILNKYYFPDLSPNDKKVEINNTQTGNFNGSVYLQLTDLTGIEIASYESDGAAVPTKSGNTITVTAGLLYSITLDNGMVGYLNEESQDKIFFSDQAGNVDIATLENVVLATFWNTKSEFGTCGNVINGYSKYLVCESAGTTAYDVTNGTNVAIPAYGEIELNIKKSIPASQTFTMFYASNEKAYADINQNGYLLTITNTNRIYIFEVTNGSAGLLFGTVEDYVEDSKRYKYKIQRNKTINQYFVGGINSFRILIKGGTFLEYTIIDTTGGNGTNPIVNSTHTTTKFISCDYEITDEISHISKDGIKYDVDKFNDGTGTYGVQKVQAQTTLLDCKGNDLEIPANVVSNSGNTFKGILSDDLELVNATYEQVYDIENDANTEITKTANKSMGWVEQLKEM